MTCVVHNTAGACVSADCSLSNERKHSYDLMAIAIEGSHANDCFLLTLIAGPILSLVPNLALFSFSSTMPRHSGRNLSVNLFAASMLLPSSISLTSQ
jgi:hypothetical protein